MNKNMGEINLWNVSLENNHKTRNVIEYIEKLDIPSHFENIDIKRFNKLKENVLNLTNADDMLEEIGYVFKDTPKCFDL